MDIYIPKKLEAAKTAVYEKHGNVGEEKSHFIDTGAFRDLIYKISLLSGNEVNRYAFSLTKGEINALATYMFTNRFEVDLTNIIRSVCFRLNDKLCARIFYMWQNAYDESRQVFMLTLLADCEEFCEYLLRSTGLSAKELAVSQQNQTVLDYITKIIPCTSVQSVEEYSSKLKEHCIDVETRLGKKLLEIFYCKCNANVYRAMGEDKLYELIHNSFDDRQAEIMRNFLMRMQYSELYNFRKLIPLFLKRTGHYGSPAFYRELNGLNETSVRNYRTWISDYEIEEAFKHDADPARLEFWKKYSSVCDTQIISKHDMIIMDFGTFVVTEFLQIGAVYWFRKDYFTNEVRNKISQSTSNIKSWLKNDSQFVHRKIHQGYWTVEASNVTGNLLRRR